jgi:hypothetical protein
VEAAAAEVVAAAVVAGAWDVVAGAADEAVVVFAAAGVVAAGVEAGLLHPKGIAKTRANNVRIKTVRVKVALIFTKLLTN